MQARALIDQARALIDNASYGPDALKAIGQAFDAAWADIEGSFGEEPERVAAARLKLANAMLSVADNDTRDVRVLKNAALQAMAKDYRVRSPRIATLLTEGGGEANVTLRGISLALGPDHWVTVRIVA